jgi:hypothetical protein
LHIFRKFHAKDPGKICRIYQFVREKSHVILFATELLVFRRKKLGAFTHKNIAKDPLIPRTKWYFILLQNRAIKRKLGRGSKLAAWPSGLRRRFAKTSF